MQTLELTADEVRKYRDACDRDAMVERSPVTWVSREAFYVCHEILRRRRLIGDPEKVTITFVDAPGPNLYELHYSTP